MKEFTILLEGPLQWSHAYDREGDSWVCKATLKDDVRSRTVWSEPAGTRKQARNEAYARLIGGFLRQHSRGTPW
jgi:hypothetical protein